MSAHTEALKLLPCPFCSSNKIEIDGGDSSVCIRCRNCGTQSGRVYFDAMEVEAENYEPSEALAIANWNRRAALALPDPSAAPVVPASVAFLQADDYLLLHRFIETLEDGEGYDIGKESIKRLADLGVVQSSGFGRYGVTMFGYWVHERYWHQNPSLPLRTNSDRDKAARARVGAPAPQQGEQAGQEGEQR